MGGTLIPDHYVPHESSLNDVALTSVIWGLSLGVALYCTETATRQTMKAYKRAHRITAYMVFMWLELASSTIMGIISWLFLKGIIQPSLEYFLAIIILWCIQVHTLMQIIINRVGILSYDKRFISKIKWGTFLLLICINVAVACIWTPASLQINDTFMRINNVFDRIQKALLCVIDAALNFYFIYLVRTRLIANGLTKYNRLFNFNLVMIGISITLDILIVVMMSLPNKLVYVQFHPLAYLLKLQIEMGMADLIVKVVRACNPNANSSDRYKKYAGTTFGAHPTGTQHNKKSGTGGGNNSQKLGIWSRHQNTTHIEIGDDADAMEMERYGNSIKKTVVMEVTHDGQSKDGGDDGEFEARSESSSTRQLKKEGFGGM